MIYKIKEPVYFCGDLHGNFRWINSYLARFEASDCSVVVCGDVGLGFQKLDAWKNTIKDIRLLSDLRKRKVRLYFVRGNHDDPSWFDDNTVNTTYMKAVSDYSILSTPNHNILCVGGGVSIDRKDRLLNMEFSKSQYFKYHPKASVEDAKRELNQYYWSDEMPVFDKEKIQNLPCQIDVVCSHAAPTFFPPLTKPLLDWYMADETLVQDCAKERNVLNLLYQELIDNQHPVKHWYYGHYHSYEISMYDKTVGHLLDMARNGNLCMVKLM